LHRARLLCIGGYTVLAVIFGIVTTIANYSGYGVIDQIEQLPIIIRAIDSTYLLNDFFTNAGANSVARLHYANFVAMLAGSERNLPLVFLMLTLCANILISVVTFHFARDLFNNSHPAGMYASALVMSVPTFDLGWSSSTYQTMMIPSTIAIPLVLAATWAVTRGNLVIGMILSGIASIIHPLFGIETGGILLIAFIAFRLISKRKITSEIWKVIILSILILTSFSFISVIPQFSQASIDSNLYVYILAYFRHPHHYVPSTFGLIPYIHAIAFATASVLVFYHSRHNREGSSNLISLILASIIFLLFIGGYVFVEIIPLRIWVTAQTFRLLYFVKWIGLILIAGMIADKNLENSTKMLYLASVLNSSSLGGAVLTQSLRAWLEQHHNRCSRILDPSLILLIIIALFTYISIPLLSIILLGLFVLLILAFDTFPRKLFYSILSAGIILTIVIGTLHDSLPSINQLDSVNSIMRNLAFRYKSELGPEGDAVAEFARQNTPEGSIFLTPPTWGQFRLLARRAIVIDFKAFPFADTAILEWYARMTNCYGYPTLRGFAMVNELNENYQGINDSILISLQEKYGFSYVVLYSQTSTNFDTVFSNGKYKIVFLDDRR
jgi:hypothetical protein